MGGPEQQRERGLFFGVSAIACIISGGRLAAMRCRRISTDNHAEQRPPS